MVVRVTALSIPDALAARILAVEGEIDLATGAKLHDALHQMIRAGARQIIVDLRPATYVDSTALGICLNAQNRLDALGGSLFMVAERPGLVRIIDRLGLRRVLPTFGRLSTAIDELRTTAA